MAADDVTNLEAGHRAFDAEDFGVAFPLLLPYAESGDAVAQCRVAFMYQVGAGTRVDGPKAVEWYLRVAQQEIQEEHSVSALAYHNLGTIYAGGAPGVDPSEELSRKYWRKSLELGSNLIPPEWAK